MTAPDSTQRCISWDTVRRFYPVALDGGLAVVATGFALGYFTQPITMTRYLGGRLFREGVYLRGLKTGLLAGFVLPVAWPYLLNPLVKCAVCPALHVLPCDKILGLGESGDPGVLRVSRDLIKRGLLVYLHTYLIRRKVMPDTSNWLFGFSTGSLVTWSLASTAWSMLTRSSEQK